MGQIEETNAGIAIALARLGDEDMDHFFPQKPVKIKRRGYCLKSVQRSDRRCEKHGVDGLLWFHYAGRQSRLTPEQEAVLQKEQREHLYTSTEQFQVLIEEAWGIHHSRNGLRDSPNLNLIERLWGFMHRKILNGVFYETYSKFKLAIRSFFENMDQ